MRYNYDLFEAKFSLRLAGDIGDRGNGTLCPLRMRFALSMYMWFSTPPTFGWKKSDIILGGMQDQQGTNRC